MKMENLGSDIQRKIALELSPLELINFCSTNKIFNKNICNSYDFWIQKLKIDYPEELLDEKKITNPKELYIFRFTEIIKEIENSYSQFVMEIFGEKYLSYFNDNFKNDFTKTIYSIYQQLKEPELTSDDENDIKGEIYFILYTPIDFDYTGPEIALNEILKKLFTIDQKYKDKFILLQSVKK